MEVKETANAYGLRCSGGAKGLWSGDISGYPDGSGFGGYWCRIDGSGSGDSYGYGRYGSPYNSDGVSTADGSGNGTGHVYGAPYSDRDFSFGSGHGFGYGAGGHGGGGDGGYGYGFGYFDGSGSSGGEDYSLEDAEADLLQWNRE